MALMLTLLPPYLTTAGIVARRHSLNLLEQLRSELPRSADYETARLAIAGGLKKGWLQGAALGVAMGLLNTSVFQALNATVAPRVHLAITVGQLLLWLSIGLLFSMRFEVAKAFRRLGATVRFDLFELDLLKPLARSGLSDVVAIAGALALTPLQALDAEFRWYNYQYGLSAALIASTVLVLWPLWPIHLRIRAEKERRIDALDAEIRSTGKTQNRDTIVQLESLLAHRDRLRSLHTWLFSTDLVSRFLLYLVIPPVAWVGAAIVEHFVDRLLGG
jgi:hypothetical protein